MTFDVCDMPETHLIYYPTAAGYKTAPVLSLLGHTTRRLVSAAGFGVAPIRFITQRGPEQDGETPVAMRWDGRTVQVGIRGDLYDQHYVRDFSHDLVDKLRPNRAFAVDGTVSPLVYRVKLPGGKTIGGHDMEVTNGSATVTALNGRFVHTGGLEPYSLITIGGVDYVVESVVNDTKIILTANYAGVTASGVAYSYLQLQSTRDLFCLLEQGPAFDIQSDRAWRRRGYNEVLRFVAHDPFWYGDVQTANWIFPEDFGDLVFDSSGAYYAGYGVGISPSPAPNPAGRWLFAPDSIGETLSIKYWGTRRAQPLVRINGPAVAPVVINETTGKRIDMTFDLLPGENATIDFAALTVTRSDGVNLLRYTTGDLATFGIEPDPRAPDGVNEITVAFSGASPGSSATLTYRSAYANI